MIIISKWYHGWYVSQIMTCPNDIANYMFHKKWYVRIICFIKNDMSDQYHEWFVSHFSFQMFGFTILFGRDYKDFLVEKLGYVYLGLQNVKNFGKISVILGFSWLQ